MQKYSNEHIKYLKKQKRTTVCVNFTRFGILVAFLFVWEALSSFGIIDGFLFSSPSRILRTIKDLYSSGELFAHVGTTLYETLLGFAIASALGITIAVAMWWSGFLRRVLEPYVVTLNSLPKIALGPLIIIWFGAGTASIVFMAVIITVIVTVISMLSGFMETDENKILLLRSMRANKAQIFTRLVFPASLPTLISTLKINVGMSWIGSVMGEYLVSRQGIGYLIVYGGQVFKLDLVMASTVILCALAGLMYAAVSFLEKLLLKWR
ncbi:MAG: ABC transporter permease [Clostridia bacterium]|nr:ABC transporter permease [Clostridia bacterium]